MTRAQTIAVYACVALLTRLPDFAHPVAAANEGLYACVARELLHGHLPYLTAWEAKPPLFFAAIAAGMAVMGGSLAGLRIVNIVAVFVTMLSLDRIGRRLSDGSPLRGMLPALIFAGVSCSDAGTSVEAEVLGSAFAALGFSAIAPFVQTRAVNWRALLVAGLCAGCAFEMKVTFALSAFWLLACAMLLTDSWRRRIACASVAVLPVVASAAPYAFSGTLGYFWDAVAATVLRRGGSPHVPVLSLLREQGEAFFPLWLCVVWLRSALRHELARRRGLLFLSAWAVAAVLQVAVVGEYFGYHWISLFAPAALLSSRILLDAFPNYQRRAALAALALVFVAHVPGRIAHVWDRDPLRAVSMQVSAQPHASGTWLYIAGADPALYVLTGAPLPTRFPYTQHITQPDQQRAAGIGGAAEMQRIVDTGPQYIVYRPWENQTSAASVLLKRTLASRYTAVASSGDVVTYRATADLAAGTGKKY